MKKDLELDMAVNEMHFEIMNLVHIACNRKKITKHQLAKLLGVSSSYINQLYTGKKIVSFLQMAKFQQVLDIRFETKAIK
jgi:transcriptional regulator with XRE-family HTH domain